MDSKTGFITIIVMVALTVLIAGCNNNNGSLQTGNNTAAQAGNAQQPNIPVANESYGASRNATVTGKFCGKAIGTCSTDADCKLAGEYNQICSSLPVTSSGDNLSCYNAKDYGVTCGCVKGQCAWYSG